MSYNNAWVLSANLAKDSIYKKKFAFFPKKMQDGSKIWLKVYYRKYDVYRLADKSVYQSSDIESQFYHKKYIESITEDEFLVRKLIGDR